MCRTNLLLLLLLFGHAQSDCTKDSLVLSSLIDTGAGQSRPDASPLTVEIGFSIQKLNVVPHANSLHLDGIITRKWKDESLYFTHLNPCRQHISLTRSELGNMWTPEISFVNSESIIKHPHSVVVEIYDNGTVIHTQRIEENIACATDLFAFPWGNTSCSMIWRSEKHDTERLRLDWNADVGQQPNVTDESIGDYVLRMVSFNHRLHERGERTYDELSLTFYFKRAANKTVMLFFIPSMMFMMLSWWSLLLGPMAITRSLIVIGSFILLIMHYYVNMAGLPNTTGITSLDVWKLFSLTFVFVTFVELVCVTCMASAGRSRRYTSCAGKSHKGKYEMEPVYEELNDLRQRKTRRTCRCCRYAALFLDFITFVLLGLALLLVLFIFYTRGPQLVRHVNGFRMEHFQIPIDF